MAKKSGIRPLHDYAALLAEFEADYRPNGRTLQDLADERGIERQTLANAFTRERKRTALEAFHARNKALLLKAQRKVNEALDSDRLKPEFAAGFALKTMALVSEREEPNPLLAQQTNVIIPPLFAMSPLAEAFVLALTGRGVEHSVPAGGTYEGQTIGKG
jgi:hypothetical protein